MKLNQTERNGYYAIITDELLKFRPDLRTALKGDKTSAIVFLLMEEWRYRLNTLNDIDLRLYANGLCHHQGKKFIDIHRAEKEYISSSRTLTLHLRHLSAIGLVNRDPPSGGRGKSGKYYFAFPALPDKINGSMAPLARTIREGGYTIEMNVLSKLADDPLSNGSQEQQIEELTTRLLRMHYVSGLISADLLERSIHIRGKGKGQEFYIRQRRIIEKRVTHAINALLAKHPKIARDSAKALYDRLRSDLVVLQIIPSS